MRFRVNKKARPEGRYTETFMNYDDDENTLDSMVGFLRHIWDDAPKYSFLFLATTNKDGSR